MACVFGNLLRPGSALFRRTGSKFGVYFVSTNVKFGVGVEVHVTAS